MFATSTVQGLFYGLTMDVSTLLGVFLGVVVAILAAVLGLGFGLSSVATWIYNKEVSLGLGHHFGAVPWKGYNRWRSRQWNMEHTAL